MFGICNLAIIPLRIEPNDRSEIVSQVLFGEHFEVLETLKQWAKIKLQFDNYEGWIDTKQFQPISKEEYKSISEREVILNGDLIDYITGDNNFMMPIPLGASLSFLDDSNVNLTNYDFEGAKISGVKPKSELIKTAFMYLNAPYLWGGKSPFGIDCSGFTQLIFKLNGYQIPRDASHQVELGTPLSFVEEAQSGDLAFFDNEEGNIVHVGMVIDNQQIIHASGSVRIDKFDHYGIFNSDTKKYSHMLRVIKNIIK